MQLNQMDAGLFVGDDWRVRPNLTLSLGLRWETQTNISDHNDWAPRIGFAWAPGIAGQRRVSSRRPFSAADSVSSTIASANRTFSRRSAITGSTSNSTS